MPAKGNKFKIDKDVAVVGKILSRKQRKRLSANASRKQRKRPSANASREQRKRPSANVRKERGNTKYTQMMWKFVSNEKLEVGTCCVIFI